MLLASLGSGRSDQSHVTLYQPSFLYPFFATGHCHRQGTGLCGPSSRRASMFCSRDPFPPHVVSCKMVLFASNDLAVNPRKKKDSTFWILEMPAPFTQGSSPCWS